jgi:hypothetical protein
MTTPANNIPISVDYTSRDYYAIREELIKRIQSRIPQWTGNDPADFGVALVEAFSYLGDNINYYIDRIANELNINTATQRQSLINIANSYGYIPSGYRSSTLSLLISSSAKYLTAPVTAAAGDGTKIVYTAANTFSAGQIVTVAVSSSTYNVTGATILSANSTTFSVASSVATSASVTGTASVPNTVVIPAGTQAVTNVTYNDVTKQLIYTIPNDVSVAAQSNGVANPTLISVNQGEHISLRSGNEANGAYDVAGELLGTSDGSPNQTFMLKNNQVVDGSIALYVQDGTYYQQWTQVQNLTDYGPTSPVFSVTTDSNDFATIVFGDGISGVIPPKSYPIKADYVVGDGSLGNIATNQVFNLYKIPATSASSVAAINQLLTITNATQGLGGADPESNDSIRRNAPKALTTLNRAVTLKDYANLALTVNGVGKANADAQLSASVNVYLAPQRNTYDTDLYPGFDNANTTVQTELTSLITSVQNFLVNKIQIGTTVTVLPVTYVPISLSISYTILPTYTDARVRANILDALLSRFSYNQMLFADTIYPEDVEYRLRSVEGVLNLKVVYLYRTGLAASRTAVVGAANEVFVVTQSNLTLTAQSTNPNLSALTFSTGTLSPTFSSTFHNYNLSVSSGTSTVNVTATNSTASSITINGTVVTSGSPAATSLPTNPTTLTIVGVAQDGVTKSTYKVTVTKG